MNLLASTPDRSFGFGDGADHEIKEYTGNTYDTKFSVTMGGVTNVYNNFIYVYFGAGFGWRMFYDSYDNYEISNSTFDQNTGSFLYNYKYEGSYWENDQDKSVVGVETEMGILLNFNRFCIGGGVTSTQFKYWTATFGIGLSY